MMERSEIMAAMGGLKLFGMRAAYDEVVATAVMRERRHPNVVAVALANKNARIVWSILARGEEYSPGQMGAAA